MPSSALDFSTSLTLIQRGQARDPEAWVKLVKLYGPLIYGWARQGKLQSADASEVVQTVFVKVWRNLPNFSLDQPGATFRGWLRVITRNVICELARKKRLPLAEQWPLEALVDPDSVTPDQEEITPAESQGLLLRALNIVRDAVDESTWQVFWLVTVDNHSPKEVAQGFGMTPGAVSQAKYRVLCQLRNLLADR